jgi:ABC-2 type transport system ATP-binding protein
LTRDVSEICTHIGIIEAGKMVAQGSMNEMRAQLMPHREIMVTVRDTEAAEKVRQLIAGMPDVVNVEILEAKAGRERVRIDFTGDDDGVAAINQKLHGAGIAILGFTEETKDLEAMFMRVTKGIVT